MSSNQCRCIKCEVRKLRVWNRQRVRRSQGHGCCVGSIKKTRQDKAHHSNVSGRKKSLLCRQITSGNTARATLTIALVARRRDHHPLRCLLALQRVPLVLVLPPALVLANRDIETP